MILRTHELVKVGAEIHDICDVLEAKQNYGLGGMEGGHHHDKNGRTRKLPFSADAQESCLSRQSTCVLCLRQEWTHRKTVFLDNERVCYVYDKNGRTEKLSFTTIDVCAMFTTRMEHH